MIESKQFNADYQTTHGVGVPAISRVALSTLKGLSQISDPYDDFWLQDEPFTNLLQLFSQSNCSDHRDRINALVGLVDWIKWVPDYSAHWTDEYERLARATLQKEGGSARIEWHLLVFGSLRDNVPGCLPWVPDWSQAECSDVPKHWLGRISFTDASGMWQRPDVESHVHDHLSLFWFPWLYVEANPRSEPREIIKGALMNEVECDPRSNQTGLLATLLEILEESRGRLGADDPLLKLALRHLLVDLIPQEYISQAYFSDRISYTAPRLIHHTPHDDFFGPWLEYLDHCRTVATYNERLDSNVRLPDRHMCLRKVLLLNDVLLPCLADVLKSNTIFWTSCKDRQASGDCMVVGIAMGTGLTPDQLSSCPRKEYGHIHRDGPMFIRCPAEEVF